MTKPIVKIVNSETGEEIEREMNAAEFTQYNLDAAASVAKQNELAEIANQKNALLEKLGITVDEAKLLLS